jgi:acyl-CoA thioesterase FadM
MPRIKLQEQPAYEFHYEVTVQVRDINYGGHLGNDALVGLLHEARIHLLYQLGLSEKNLGDGQTGLVMADLDVNFIGEGFLLETLCIESHIGEIAGHGFRIFHRITKADKLLALAETGLVTFDYAKQKVASLPTSFRRALDRLV